MRSKVKRSIRSRVKRSTRSKVKKRIPRSQKATYKKNLKTLTKMRYSNKKSSLLRRIPLTRYKNQSSKKRKVQKAHLLRI